MYDKNVLNICKSFFKINTFRKYCDFCFQNRGGGLDMNVRSAWEQGVTGKGVVVTILDDGIEKDHPDLIANYVSLRE